MIAASRKSKTLYLRMETVPVIIISLLLFLSLTDLCYSQPLPIPEGSKCAECGMSVDRVSKFSGEVVTTDDKKQFFCDVGDLLLHFRSSREKLKSVYVKDYITGGWTDGRKAFYVFNKQFHTPMSWGIAAFSDKAEAEKWGSPVDFNGAFKLLK